FGSLPHDRSGGGGADEPPRENLPEELRRCAAGERALSEAAAGSPVPRLPQFLRILRRRYGPWSRSLAPDRMDRADRQAPAPACRIHDSVLISEGQWIPRQRKNTS